MSITEEKHLFQQDCGYVDQWLQRGLFAFKVTIEREAKTNARSSFIAKRTCSNHRMANEREANTEKQAKFIH